MTKRLFGGMLAAGLAAGSAAPALAHGFSLFVGGAAPVYAPPPVVYAPPPVVYTPPALKPKETRRKRRVGYAQDARATDEAGEIEEADEASRNTQARSAPVPQHQLRVEGAERKIPFPNGKLSDVTLKSLLEAQEQEGKPTPEK